MNLQDKLIENVADLNPNDIVITTSSSDFRCYKILEKPRLSKKKYWNGKDRYIAVKCLSNVIEKTNQWKDRAGNIVTGPPYKVFEFKIPNENASIVKIDLNYKKMFKIN